MYNPDSKYQPDFFKPLNRREKDRLNEMRIRAKWLEKKENDWQLTHPITKFNLYRKERSATLWAIAYIEAHDEQIRKKL